jgi:SAM-dependent methyltransferase
MSKAPYAEEILYEPEPEGRDPWDAWDTAQKYGAPFWQWYVRDRLKCTDRDVLVTARRNEGALAMRERLNVEPASLRGRALDLGCGPVSMLEGYPELGVVAFDPSLASYAAALPDMALLGRVNNCDYRDCLIQDIPEEDFDWVWCYNVLDHAVDWRDILVHIHRVLKPGGVLLLIVDVRRRLSPHKEERVCHPLVFPAEDLLEAMRAVGFHIRWHAGLPEEYEQVRLWPLIAERRAGL